MALFITACEERGEETNTNSQTVSEPISSPEPTSGPEMDYSTDCEKLTTPFEYTATDLYRDSKVIKAIHYTEEQSQSRELGKVTELRESIEFGEFDYEAGEEVVILNKREKNRLFEIATGYTQSGVMAAAAC